MKPPWRSMMWQGLFSVLLMLIGFIMALVQANMESGQPTATSGILIFTGFAWFVLNRIRVWWYRKKTREVDMLD